MITNYYTENYKNKKNKNGEIIRFYKNGKVKSIKNYIKNVKHGKQMSYYKDGKLHISCEYVYGILNKDYIENNNFYLKLLYRHRNFPLSGLGQYKSVECSFINGKLNSEIRFFNHKKYNCETKFTFTSGILNGHFYYSNYTLGKFIKGFYTNGKLNKNINSALFH